VCAIGDLDRAVEIPPIPLVSRHPKDRAVVG